MTMCGSWWCVSETTKSQSALVEGQRCVHRHRVLTISVPCNPCTVFPTNLVSYPYVRLMLCNLAHSLSGEKVNHELLCTAARWTLYQNSGAVQRSHG